VLLLVGLGGVKVMLVVTVMPGLEVVGLGGGEEMKVILVVTVTTCEVGREGPVVQYLPKQVGQLGGCNVTMVVVMVGSSVRVRVRVTVVGS